MAFRIFADFTRNKKCNPLKLTCHFKNEKKSFYFTRNKKCNPFYVSQDVHTGQTVQPNWFRIVNQAGFLIKIGDVSSRKIKAWNFIELIFFKLFSKIYKGGRNKIKKGQLVYF